MRNQKLKVKKLIKKNAQRKDYEKKKNIIANRPSKQESVKKPIFKQERDRKGVVKVFQIDSKEVRYSVKIPLKKTKVSFPKSRKYKEENEEDVKTKGKTA